MLDEELPVTPFVAEELPVPRAPVLVVAPPLPVACALDPEPPLPPSLPPPLLPSPEDRAAVTVSVPRLSSSRLTR